MARIVQHSAVVLLALANMAQSSPASHSSITQRPTPTSSHKQAPQTHTVSVGYGAQFKFVPFITYADPGDTVEFDFYPANHSVVRSEWTYPCIPYEDFAHKTGGFFSGFKPIAKITNDPPTFSIAVNDSDPIYYYCSAPNACIGRGMVGAINPNSSADAHKQQHLAKQATLMLQPGQPIPAEGTSTIPSITTATSTTVASSSSTAVPQPVHHGNGGGGSGLSGGAIAGIVVGVVAFVAILVALFFYIGRFRSLKESLGRTTAPAPTNAPTPAMQQGNAGTPTPSQFRDSNLTAYEHPPQYINVKGPEPYDGFRGVSPQPHTTGDSPRLSELGAPQGSFSTAPVPDPKEPVRGPVELPGSEK